MSSKKRKSSCPFASSKKAPQRKKSGKKFENHRSGLRETSDHIAARASYGHLGYSWFSESRHSRLDKNKIKIVQQIKSRI